MLQGGGVDYDVPKRDPQNRRLPSVPDHGEPVHDGGHGTSAVRDLVYDIPRSLEKTRVHATWSQSSSPGPDSNVYDILPAAAQLRVVSPATLAPNHRGGASLTSPLYKSGDSAVDLMSNRSSLMSNTSSPPGSDITATSTTGADIYDTPSSVRVLPIRKNFGADGSRRGSDPLFLPQSNSTDGLYDIPKTLQEAALDYRDSGIYDNARLSSIQVSPQKYNNQVQDSVSSFAVSSGTSSASSGTPAVNSGLYNTSTASVRFDTTVYDVPARIAQKAAPEDNTECSMVNDMDKLSLDLEEAIDIIVNLQQHAHTSSNRLLSFVHSKWRQRSNLELVLYDLKIACVGFQSTLQEFYDFGIGALANSAEQKDKTVMNRLSHALVPLKQKLEIVNSCMKVRPVSQCSQLLHGDSYI